MDFLKPFKALRKKVKGKMQQVQDEQEINELLEHWQKQFDADRRAKKPWDERFDKWEAMYNGNREFNNLTIYGQQAEREPRTVINFVRMVVEALIDLGIPEPEFKPVARDDEEVVKELKAYVTYITRASDPTLEEINLENERRILKLGGAFWKIHWNNNIKRAGYVGDIEISNPHPKDIIPNHAATSMDDLEHYHHVANRTAKYILRRWKHLTFDDLEQDAMLYKEYDEMIDDSSRINVGQYEDGDKDAKLNKYTVIETTYKDEDGDIGKLWWSGDLLIEHLPKFYFRRDDEGNLTETEPLEEDLQVRAGMTPDGEPIFETIPAYREEITFDEETGEPVPVQVQNEVEYYIPKGWDLVYQPFIPRDKCFWGISIMEDLHDLNESIKKAVYVEEETRLRGRKKIIVSSADEKQKIEDPYSEVIIINDPSILKEVDLNTNFDGIEWIEKLKEWMQLMTGATNAVLGVKDTNVNSGRQAQIYIEQANFKVSIKTAYKASAYKNIYRTIADFALAFCDFDRPFRLSGDQKKEEYGVFNRLNMLRDANGNLIYPDYDLDISAEAGFMKSKADIFNNVVQLAGQGRFEPSPGNLTFLKVLEKLGVPILRDVIEDMEQEIQMMQQQAQMQAQQQQPDIDQILTQLPPDEQQAFMSLPPEEQQAMLQQILGGM